MSINWASGMHGAIGRRVDASAYSQYIGRWSRLFVPALLAAAELTERDRVLDVATGTGEAAHLALTAVGPHGLVVGADVSSAMLEEACARLPSDRFLPVISDGQALVFPSESFDAVLCQLGLMFFPEPARGLAEFRRVLRPGRRAAVCVISSSDRVPMWGPLADALSCHLPEQRDALHLSFSLADPARLEQLFGQAGFDDVQITMERREDTVASFDEYWSPIEAGAGQMPTAYRSLSEATRHAVREEVRARLVQFESNGRFTLPAEMLIGSGRARSRASSDA